MYIKYCKTCILPETKPDLQIFEDGECDACKSFKNRKLIDWDKRKKELIKVAKKFKSKNNNYDCIVPVSGGKRLQFIKRLKH